MSSTLKPAAALMTGRLAGVLVSFCIPVALARVFDPGAFGAYKQLFLLYGTLFGIAQVGMAESLFYFLPSDRDRAGRYAVNSLLVLLAAGAVCAVALCLGRRTVGAWLGNGALADAAPLLGIFLALMLGSAGLEIVLTARKRYTAAAGVYAASDLARAALFVIPVLLVRTLDALLYGAIAFAAARLLAGVVLLRREFGPGLGADTALLRRQLAYAMPFELAVVVEILQANWHQYAVAHRFDAATFAVYSVGCLQVPLVDLVASSTCNVMMVQMAEEVAAGRTGAALETWRDAVRRLALVFVPLVGFLLVGARDLVLLLFTGVYIQSVPIFMIWCVAFLLAALPVDGVLRVCADTRYLLFLGVAKLALVMALAPLFLDRLGLIGGVVVALLAILVGKILALARIRTRLRAPLTVLLPWTDLAGVTFAAALSGLAALLAQHALDLPPLASLVVTGGLYAATCAVLAGGLAVLRSRVRPFLARAGER
ncbi:MAG TPA: oligosaccharide flippase family protein [Patescibacteria group bacterium]|nr:oligosaccharide flippase family protein [Patescibacteria group bacterium]